MQQLARECMGEQSSRNSLYLLAKRGGDKEGKHFEGVRVSIEKVALLQRLDYGRMDFAEFGPCISDELVVGLLRKKNPPIQILGGLKELAGRFRITPHQTLDSLGSIIPEFT